jgi:surface protein
MQSMFQNAMAFNQPIGNWNVSKVQNMGQMFYNAWAFNQDLSGWNVSSVTNMNQMCVGVTFSTSNYDALLIAWAALPLKSDVQFHAGNSLPESQAAIDAKAYLVATYNWTIIDGT